MLQEVCVWCASGLIYGYMFSGYAFVLDCGIETVYNFIVRGFRFGFCLGVVVTLNMDVGECGGNLM